MTDRITESVRSIASEYREHRQGWWPDGQMSGSPNYLGNLVESIQKIAYLRRRSSWWTAL